MVAVIGSYISEVVLALEPWSARLHMPFITPGAAASAQGARATPDGGTLIGAGESHRVSKGDVVIIPPGAPHMYRNIEEPFRYLVVQTP